MANECRIIDNKVGGDHRSLAENPMAHALSSQWPFGKSKLDLKQSSLRRVRSNNLKLASWRAALVARRTGRYRKFKEIYFSFCVTCRRRKFEMKRLTHEVRNSHTHSRHQPTHINAHPMGSGIATGARWRNHHGDADETFLVVLLTLTITHGVRL
jgi:hypothetical protein